MRRGLVRPIGLLVLALLVVPTAGARATVPGDPGIIAFVREGRHRGIYTIEPSGTNLIQLTDGQDYRPRWSPDGSRIVFQRFDGDRSFLWTMDADGSNLEPLGVEGSQPSWSPDGTRIAFCRGPRYRLNEIFTVNVDGSDLRQLTHDRVPDVLPTWSPDGLTILYTHGEPHADLYLMEADGSEQRPLTRNRWNDYAGDWSPDGSTIVFHRQRAGNWDLYAIHPDGSGLERLTDTKATEWAPAWSPDGSRITYTLADPRVGWEDIAILNLDDHVVVRFVTEARFDLEPGWQPV